MMNETDILFWALKTSWECNVPDADPDTVDHIEVSVSAVERVVIDEAHEVLMQCYPWMRERPGSAACFCAIVGAWKIASTRGMTADEFLGCFCHLATLNDQATFRKLIEGVIQDEPGTGA